MGMGRGNDCPRAAGGWLRVWVPALIGPLPTSDADAAADAVASMSLGTARCTQAGCGHCNDHLSDGQHEDRATPLPAPVAHLLESVRLHWPAAEGLECRSDGESVVLDIAPLPGRAVVFLSGAVDHAVLPVEEGFRAALTAWMQ